MGLAQATGALGQSQLGIGQYQLGLAGLVPQLYGQDTAALWTQQAHINKHLNRQKQMRHEKQIECEAYEPYERLGYLGYRNYWNARRLSRSIPISNYTEPNTVAISVGNWINGLAGIYGALQRFPRPDVLDNYEQSIIEDLCLDVEDPLAGITTGLERQKYDNGDLVEKFQRRKKLYDQFAPQRSGALNDSFN